MSKKTYWALLLNPIFLVLYGVGLRVVYRFCKFGNVSKRLPIILVIFAIGLLWLIIWTILYFSLKRKAADEQTECLGDVSAPRNKGKWQRWVLAVELVVIVLITGFYGHRIYLSAQPYNGKLWSYLNRSQTTKEMKLSESNRNFLENGLDGILDLLQKKCGMDEDWELYTANTLKITMDEEGMIQTIYAFLFALDEDGEYHAWLVDYDASKGDTMTVYLDNNGSTDYLEQKRLSPLLDMIDALLDDSTLLAKSGFAVAESDDKTQDSSDESNPVITLRYSGYADGNYQTSIEGTWYCLMENEEEDTENDEGFEDDEDRGNITYRLQEYTAPQYGGSDDGYLMAIYYNDIKLLTTVAEPGTLDTIAEIEERESEEVEISEAMEFGKTLVSDNSGMTFYLDEESSMSLTVVDAAAGSRAYSFQNGDIYNADPFHGRSGVAESIYFLDELRGFLLLSNASADSSHMYYTYDGGVSFEEVILPVSDGEEDMAGNELGFTSEDMDYIYTPYEEDGVLYVEVSCEASGASYMKMLFVSDDCGASWRYVSYEG